jgi:hypothetical protein
METEKQRALYTCTLDTADSHSSVNSAVSFVLPYILFAPSAINFSVSLVIHLYVTDDIFYLNNDF